jgi:hypothetical protein
MVNLTLLALATSVIAVLYHRVKMWDDQHESIAEHRSNATP